MNFFAHQDRARRKTRWLVGLFLLAVLAIVILVNLVVAIVFVGSVRESADAAYGHLGGVTDIWVLFWNNPQILVFSSLGTLALVGGASAFRMMSLSAGGSTVAKGMGGTLVHPDTTDTDLRRLRNVVEEVALASGVPTPQVYVMDDEEGINAFAAGYSPADAAIAVTRGTLTRLTRDELQGVVAHEFSHVLNGDMRLNIRLMGVLFGILAISTVGRFIMNSSSRARIGSDRKGGGLVLAGLALFVIGYVGVFFGRLIKAGVSRQREYLADASAIQFTRQPEGIAGALKKIGAAAQGSRLHAADTEEVSHMLFASGLKSFSSLLATHPPLVDRIRAIEPRFDPAEFQEIQTRWAREAAAGLQDEAARERRAAEDARKSPLPTIPGFEHAAIPTEVLAGAVLAGAGAPSDRAIDFAGALIDGLPKRVYDGVHDREAVGAVVLALIAADAGAGKARDYLERALPAERAQAAVAWIGEVLIVPSARRLAVVELALPALREWDKDALKQLLNDVRALVQVDGEVTPFEYATARVLLTHVRDVIAPGAAGAGRRKLVDVKPQAASLLAVLAHWGHEDPAQARLACDRGLAHLFPMERPAYQPPQDWVRVLDGALDALDGLDVVVKEALVQAVVMVVEHDGRVTLDEAALVRAICAAVHVPVPPVVGEAG